MRSLFYGLVKNLPFVVLLDIVLFDSQLLLKAETLTVYFVLFVNPTKFVYWYPPTPVTAGNVSVFTNAFVL